MLRTTYVKTVTAGSIPHRRKRALGIGCGEKELDKSISVFVLQSHEASGHVRTLHSLRAAELDVG